MRSIRAAAAAAILCMAVVARPVPATAQAGLLTTASIDGGYLYVDAAGGWSNSISVSRNTTSDFLVTDLAGILPGNGCVSLGPLAVECVALSTAYGVSVNAGDQDDNVTVSASAVSESSYYPLYVYVSGGAGNDVLQANAGRYSSFSLYGDGGMDVLYGSTDDDYLDGGWDHDVAYGGDGDDTIIGDEGMDNLYGEGGNDYVNGDYYCCTGEDDYLNGGTGNDTLLGEGGNDTIIGGPGVDDLYGHDGDDYLIAADGWEDSLWCGAGTDDTYYDYTLDWRNLCEF
jgi:Ca2+-binding RTX toxin-like protein